MHISSYENMEKAVEKHLKNKTGTVLDIGSYDVNGSYKPIFVANGFNYIGADLEKGPNVDIVLANAYKYPFRSNKFDVVISGQAFEHIEYFWIAMVEMARVTKVGGILIVIAPSRGPEHRHPQDCWRFYPDGYRALAKFADLELIDHKVDWDKHPDGDSAQWGDCVGIFEKKSLPLKKRLLGYLYRALLSSN
jgi:SAM-dependent methyltransferase